MTQVEICNLALMKCGGAAIASLAEASQEAVACTLAYGPVRQQVLRQIPWTFALRTVALAQLEDAPAGYSYGYQLPSDFLRVISMVIDGDSSTSAAVQFQVRGTVLCTDQEAVTIIYIGDEEDTAVFDPLFVDAMAFRLAAEIIPALRGDSPSQRTGLMQLYQMALRNAAGPSAKESGNRGLRKYSDFVNARG